MSDGVKSDVKSGPSELVRTGLALATDPDGHRHVLASATRRLGPRAGWQGLADLSAGGRPGSFARLVAPTRIDDDAQLADLLAHLVPLPAPMADAAVDVATGTAPGKAADDAESPADVVDVIDLTGGPPLPERIPAPGGRDLVLRQGAAPFDLDGRALLFANERAPGGAFWAPVGETPPEIDGLGELLAWAGLFGSAVRSRCSGRFERDVLKRLGLKTLGLERPDLEKPGLAPLDARTSDASEAEVAQLAMVLEARLRGTDTTQDAALRPSEIRASLDRRVATAPVCWSFAAGSTESADSTDGTDTADDEPRATFVTADWMASAVADLDAARGARLFPYWLLVFEPDAHGRLRFTRAENARRRLAARAPTASSETGPVWVLEEDA